MRGSSLCGTYWLYIGCCKSLIFFETVSHSVAVAGLKLGDLLASASPVLGLKGFTTICG